MTQIMTPSEMTDGQINKSVGLYRAMLEKHRAELGSEAVQQVLGQEDFVGEMVGVLRRRVEAIGNMIVRRVHVNRSLTHQQAIEATGRVQCVNSEILGTAPKGNGEEVDMYFFDLDYDPTVDELDREMNIRGLKPDVDALAAFNAANPTFADDRPNVTQWRDANGKACDAVFDRRRYERLVFVDRLDYGWGRPSRFSGVRK